MTCPRIKRPPPEVGVVLSTLMRSLPTPAKSGSRTAAEMMSFGLIEDLSHTFGGPLVSSRFAGAGGDRGLAFPATGTFPAPLVLIAAALLLDPFAVLHDGMPPVSLGSVAVCVSSPPRLGTRARSKKNASPGTGLPTFR